MKLNKIKDVLDSKGISQTWLAKQLGKSFSTVNCYARNKYGSSEKWSDRQKIVAKKKKTTELIVYI